MQIIGIDEVGRGPFAGPVTVCAVICEESVYRVLKKSRTLPGSGKDSKKLKEKDREKYAKILKEISKKEKISYKIIHVSNKTIDLRGLSFSIKKAIGLCVVNLKPDGTRVLLDGGLKAPEKFKNQKTIIKGDEKEKIIAWASILAKVSRDSLMIKLSKRYPKYGFDIHKGYGTLKHRNAIKKYGASDIHRKTWIG